MTFWDGFFMVLVIVLILSIFGVLLYLKKKNIKNPERPANAPIVLNLLTKFTDGKAIGTYISRKEGSNKMDHITFLPSDLYEDKDGNLEIPQLKTIIINREKQLVTISKGSLSKDRSWYWILPKSPDELPEELRKDSVIGTALETAIIVKKVRNTLIDSFKAGGEAQEQLAVEIKMGELTKEALDIFKKQIEEKAKLIEISNKSNKPQNQENNNQ